MFYSYKLIDEKTNKMEHSNFFKVTTPFLDIEDEVLIGDNAVTTKKV